MTPQRSLAVAAYRAGLLSSQQVDELRRWKLPVEQLHEEVTPPTRLDDVVSLLDEALQSEGLILSRTTDLDAAQQYLRTMEIGKLVITVGGEEAVFPIAYGKSEMGDYLIAWRGNNVLEELTNGLSYLVTAKGEQVYFVDVTELFFGDQKAFMSCRPVTP